MSFASLSAEITTVSGRSGEPLYQIEIPDSWVSIEVPVTEDTKEPIAKWEAPGIQVVLHNFPEMNIPPEAQVERWRRQKPADHVTPQAFSGFQGLLYENDTTMGYI